MEKNKEYLTLENLQQYHNLLMKSLKNPRMIPINRCPQCGGIINEINICEYCGTKLKLVAG